MPGLDVDKTQQLNPGRMRSKQWQGCFEHHLPRMKQQKEQPSGPISALWPVGCQQASSNAQLGMRQSIDFIAGFGKWPKSS
jgi:hypothetical protein